MKLLLTKVKSGKKSYNNIVKIVKLHKTYLN